MLLRPYWSCCIWSRGGFEAIGTRVTLNFNPKKNILVLLLKLFTLYYNHAQSYLLYTNHHTLYFFQLYFISHSNYIVVVLVYRWPSLVCSRVHTLKITLVVVSLSFQLLIEYTATITFYCIFHSIYGIICDSVAHRGQPKPGAILFVPRAMIHLAIYLHDWMVGCVKPSGREPGQTGTLVYAI